MADAPQFVLDHHLKTLKPPTFLREYAKQARLSADEGVDHTTYLARLAELESCVPSSGVTAGGSAALRPLQRYRWARVRRAALPPAVTPLDGTQLKG